MQAQLIPFLVVPALIGAVDEQAIPVEFLTLDELVQELPPAARQVFWDREKEDFHIAPSVAELKRRLSDDIALSDEQWRVALLRSGALHARERWLVSKAFAVSMEVPHWLGPATIRATPRVSGWSGAVAGDRSSSGCGNCAMSQASRWGYQELGSIAVGHHEIVFDVSIQRRPEGSLFGARSKRADDEASAGAQGPTQVWSGTMSFQVEVVDHIDEIVSPIEDSSIERALVDGIVVSFVSYSGRRDDRGLLSFELDLDQLELATTSCVLELEVLRNGVVWQCFDWSLGRRSPFIPYLPLDLPAEFEWSPEARTPWTLRVTGVDDGMHALQHWKAHRYAGSFVVPLEDVFRESQ